MSERVKTAISTQLFQDILHFQIYQKMLGNLDGVSYSFQLTWVYNEGSLNVVVRELVLYVCRPQTQWRVSWIIEMATILLKLDYYFASPSQQSYRSQ